MRGCMVRCNLGAMCILELAHRVIAHTELALGNASDVQDITAKGLGIFDLKVCAGFDALKLADIRDLTTHL